MTTSEVTPLVNRYPGAQGMFALLGEVLWVGILVSVASLGIVTAPAAVAAGVRHLDRYLHARDSGIGMFVRDFRAALLPGGLGIGLVAALAAALLVLQLLTLPGSSVPGAEVLVVVVAVLLLAGLVLLGLAAASWSPRRPWRAALETSVSRALADPVGAILVAVALALTAVATYQLPPLIVPALGCLTFALAVVRARRRRRAYRGVTRA